jgi:cytochrome c
MGSWIKRIVALSLVPLALGTAHAQLRGHGGPVKALAISPDGQHALSGSFDSSAIYWSLARNAAEQVLRFHDSAVNAVAFLPDGRLVTGGEDGKIALWRVGASEPVRQFLGHTGPVAALAISPDGTRIASASWGGTVRIWSADGSGALVLEGHRQPVNGVAFTPDGQGVVSVSQNPDVRIWRLADKAATVVKVLTPLNAVAVAADGEIVTGGGDGKLYFFSPTGEGRGALEASPTPIISIALSPDGKLIAAASIRGSVAIVDRAERKVTHTLVGPGLPVWSVAFFADNQTLLTGGADRLVRRWNAATGEPMDSITAGAPADPLAVYNGDHGAEVFRACVACHTLSSDEVNKAGPTLAGIFGRKIATLPGYNFSPALKQLDIVWTPETVAKLFEVGPMAYTPGTKMPEQKITSAEDRKALVEFLAKVTTRK